MTGLPSQFHLIGNALSSASQNHRVLSQNIANVNTPGYKTLELSFDQFLDQVENGNADQAMLKDLPIIKTEGLDTRVDGNNVDIDVQLANMKKNSLLFQTYSHLLASKMETYRRAITG